MRPSRRPALSGADEGPVAAGIRIRDPTFPGAGMSETEKKPTAAKKPRKAKPPEETRVEAETAESKTDAGLKAAVLEAALPHAAFDGFTGKVLEEAGKAAGLAPGDLARLFPDGPISLIAAYSEAVDAEMEEKLKAMALPAMKIRL